MDYASARAAVRRPGRIMRQDSHARLGELGSGAESPLSPRRFTLIGVGREQVREDFAADVRAGLGAPQKRLSCAFLYDRAGSLLFEEICNLPEYYLTRAEEEILRTRAAEIVEDLPPDSDLVELGSGSAAKTRLLIEELLRRHGRLRYVPVDISSTMLVESSSALLADYPELNVLGVAAEYRAGLHELRRRLKGPRLVLWLGSNVGNFERDEAVRFLAEVRRDLDENDRLLLGADLRKDRATLELAYDDPAGVSARFNLNLLARINRELGGHFDLDAFAHRARYHEVRGFMEMSLVSRRAQSVRIDALDMQVELAEGETIHTESSHKYSIREIEDMAEGAGYVVERAWLDTAQRFRLQRLVPRG